MSLWRQGPISGAVVWLEGGAGVLYRSFFFFFQCRAALVKLAVSYFGLKALSWDVVWNVSWNFLCQACAVEKSTERLPETCVEILFFIFLHWKWVKRDHHFRWHFWGIFLSLSFVQFFFYLSGCKHLQCSRCWINVFAATLFSVLETFKGRLWINSLFIVHLYQTAKQCH